MDKIIDKFLMHLSDYFHSKRKKIKLKKNQLMGFEVYIDLHLLVNESMHSDLVAS